ncbi:MAG: sensor histidine kinase [Frankia sp.]
MRLALLYGGLFFASGTALLAFTDAGLLGMRSTRHTAPVPNPLLQPTAGVVTTRITGADAGQLIVVSVVALVVLAVVSGALGWLVSGRVLRPFWTIVTTARYISANRLHERLDLDGSYEEFRELGNTLDDLFARLEGSFESQRHFVANASHELRTPLTAERTLIQVTLADPDASTETLRATCEELLALGRQEERLIEALLTLASGERGVEQWESVDLAQIAERVILARRDEAERRGIRVDTTLGPARTAGDPSLVECLVSNLIDNALRHNELGGWMEISTGTGTGWTTLSVANTGPVIPSDEIERLFQPFQRIGHERLRHPDGYGLGLAIVRTITDAHGASLTTRARAAGGLTIEVGFPTSPGRHLR